MCADGTEIVRNGPCADKAFPICPEGTEFRFSFKTKCAEDAMPVCEDGTELKFGGKN